MRFCSYLLITVLCISKFERYASLRSTTPRTAEASPAKPRAAVRRRGVGATAAAALFMPRVSRAVGVRDGLLDRCPETASCISSQDDAARGGRSFRPPWAYDDNDWTGARDKLLVALQRSEANDAVVDGRYIRCGDLSGASVSLKSRRRRQAHAIDAHVLFAQGVLLHGKRRHGPI